MTEERAKKVLQEQIDRYGQEYDAEGIEALEMAIKALEQTRWIPVSEKLPTTDDDVLVTTGKEIYVGWINLADKAWRVDSENEYLMDNIIAWMPLPQPYKVESEEV